MSRLIIASVAALAAALPLAPAIAQSSDYYYDSALEPSITVTAPRMRHEGRSSTGAPIRMIEADSVAYIGDLDLRTHEGRRMLDIRVDAAAREACDFLEQHYGSFEDSLTTERQCRNDAVRTARYQVRDAIERSAMTGYSGDFAYSGY